MKYYLLISFLLIKAIAFAQPSKITLVIHGGAGTILKKNMTAEKEAAYTTALNNALTKGYDTLQKGATALDAVEIVVKLLEDNPLFNAGKGAVFTNEGKNELDAAIMDGKSLAAGSVAGVTTIKNPISAARAVMEKSKHVMLTGKGAEEFAKLNGLTIVPNEYFYTEDRWKGLLKAKEAEEKTDTTIKKSAAIKQPQNKDDKYGTVGAVALDSYGNLAAATSTGGMTNKRFGRVGDAPIIGAGTYANNATCAISGTGWGEYFIRLVMAKTVSDLMEYKNYSVQKAANEMILKKLPALGGDGGLIAVDKNGNIAMPFCTEGMYRGYIKNGKAVVKIYKE
ncbi:MAG: isoaspartyl peptidase/L-asparaginase [Ferruginibacter sp.]|nr:isoaspartyl peptidase/L-asparaginase [Ferruginibacter sp.]